MQKPPLAPKPKLIQPQWPRFSPTATRKNAHAQPSPGTPERVKPALAPKPCLPKLSTAVESKPLSSKSHHQRSLSANTGMPRSVGLLNSKNGSQQENKKPDWDYVIPICLCSQENCQCVGSVAEDSRSHLARPGGKLESRGEEVEGNKHRVNSTALLPGVCLQPANAGTARPSLPHRTRSEANGDFVPLSGAGQRPGKHPPVPVPRKPRKAALARQEKVEDDREERAGSAGRETNVREVMVSAEGKSGPSLSVSVAGPAQNTPVRGEQQPPSLSVRNACPPPAPPPRKKPFLSAPERLAPAPGAPPQDVDEEDLDWGDGIYEMECSVDEGVEEVGVEKEVEARRGEPESQHGALTRLPSHSGPLDRRERSPHVACTATNSSQLAGGKGGKVPPRKPQRPGAPMSWIWKKEPSEETEEGKCPRNGKKPHLEDPPTGQATRELNPTPREKPSRSLMPALGSPGAPKPLQSSLGKQKSKSFSAADLARTEGQKRNSIQKLLDLKLSVKLLPKLNVKGGQTRGGCGHSAPAAERVQCVDGDQDRAQEIQRLERLVGRKFSCPQVGVEQSVDGDEFCSAEYENIPYYEEIPDYVNVAVGKTVDPQQAQNPPPVPLAPTLGWQHTMHDEEGDIYEAYAPPENALGQQQMLSSSERSSFEEEEEEDAYVDEGHSDDQDVTMDQSSDEEEDGGSSASSRGDTDPQGGAENERSVKKSKIHHIATEIMSSEKVFVNVLKLLHIDFRDAVSKATAQTGKPVIEERHLNQILYYLPQLYELNKDLLRELEQRVEKWDENARLADIFVKKGPYLKMYSTYIREFDKNVALLDEQSKKNPAFGGVVREFQAEPRCANLALRHYLLKPVQRIPQYQLLLTDYLKHLPPDSTDYTDTQAALGIVKEVANHANDIMKQGDNFQKLIQVQCSLNGHHEIVQPGRVFLKEGILKKLSRKIMQPRMFFLFNDTLLYTTPVQSGQFKLNNMLSLSGMKVSKPTHEAHQNELNIESVERSFILSASSATERDEWLEAIAMAISDYTRKKITFISSKTQEEMKDGAKAGGGPLGSKAPIWIPDPRATMCMICTCEFSLTWRRHHCRACGKVVCQSCSSNKHYLEYLKNQLARVCDQCFLVLQQQKCEQALSPTQAPGGRPAFTFSRKHKKIPAALKEVSASTDNYSMSGYLQRSKGNKKQVKRLWFVIKDKVLYTYAASEDVAALASQPLLGFVLKEDSSQKHEFKLFHKNTLFYIFRADDVQSAQRWIDSFKEATVL